MNKDILKQRIRTIWMEGLMIFKAVITMACLFMCAFLMDFFAFSDAQNLFKAVKAKGPRMSYTTENVSFLNGSLIDGWIVSGGGSTSFEIKDINESVGLVEIVIKDAASQAMPIDIYCENAEHTYSEDYKLNGIIQENKGGYFYELNQYVSSLCVDIGVNNQDSYVMERVILNPNVFDVFAGNFCNVSWIRILWYFIGMLVLLFAWRDFELFKYFCFKYRYVLGLSFVILYTICKLNGSSIGILNSFYPYGTDTSRLLGRARHIRTDEYVVFTEMALSQVQSGFKRFSDIWGYSPSDMFVVYGQPIRNLVAIYRPFSLGYLILGAERGLSFYWSSRLVCMFLVSFEFGRLLTKDNRLLSLAYAFLVALAPVVQWWYSINEFVEMLIFGQLAILLIFWYFKTKKYGIKILLTAGLVVCAGGYVMTLYPAWMVPFFYVFAAAAIAMLIENRKNIHIQRQDVMLWLAGMGVFSGSMLYIYITSADTIRDVMNTVYPGTRIYTGGPLSNLFELFRGWTSYLWSFITMTNPCEKTCFINFAPVGFIFSLIEIFGYKRKDPWLIILNMVNVLMVMFYIVSGWPEAFAKITLLSRSTRIMNAIGFINLLILFRALTYADYKVEMKRIFLLLSPVIAVVSFHTVRDNLNIALKVVTMFFVILTVWLLLNIQDKKKQEYFLLLVMAVSLVGGGMVNPINQGLSTIYKSPIVRAIEAENQKDEGLWVVVNGGASYNNLPTIVGAHTLNAVATYPDKTLWEDLHLTDEVSEYAWNRYAHQNIHISESTYFEPISVVDQFVLNITVEDLKKIGVKYILNINGVAENQTLDTVFTYGNLSIQKIRE